MTIGFDLGYDLDLEFSRSNMEFAISQPKMVWLPRNGKQTYRLNSKASNVTIRFDLGHDLNLEFSRSNMEFAISQPKMVWLPRNEKQTYRLNSRPQMWPMGLILTIILTFEICRVLTGLEKCLNFSRVLKKCLIFYFALKMIIFPGKVLENDNFILEKLNI